MCVQKRVIFTLKLFRKTFKKDLFIFICKVHFAEREGETERWSSHALSHLPDDLKWSKLS